MHTERAAADGTRLFMVVSDDSQQAAAAAARALRRGSSSSSTAACARTPEGGWGGCPALPSRAATGCQAGWQARGGNTSSRPVSRSADINKFQTDSFSRRWSKLSEGREEGGEHTHTACCVCAAAARHHRPYATFLSAHHRELGWTPRARRRSFRPVGHARRWRARVCLPVQGRTSPRRRAALTVCSCGSRGTSSVPRVYLTPERHSAHGSRTACSVVCARTCSFLLPSEGS